MSRERLLADVHLVFPVVYRRHLTDEKTYVIAGLAVEKDVVEELGCIALGKKWFEYFGLTILSGLIDTDQS